MSPFEAAQQVLAANGSQLLGRTIRVDKLRLPSAIGLETATSALSKRDAWLPTNTDPKKSLFVGGLDYAAKEEDVRVLFEELVKSERGASQERYVTSVRIVRDSATQLGKGFGYVHFKVSLLIMGFMNFQLTASRIERVLRSYWRWTRRSSDSQNVNSESSLARPYPPSHDQIGTPRKTQRQLRQNQHSYLRVTPNSVKL